MVIDTLCGTKVHGGGPGGGLGGAAQGIRADHLLLCLHLQPSPLQSSQHTVLVMQGGKMAHHDQLSARARIVKTGGSFANHET